MTYYLLGVCLASAALLVINALASVMTTILWRTFKWPARRWSAITRARLLFALRTAPLAGSLIFVALLLLPAYITHEPQQSAETVSVKLALLSILSISGLALALWRGLATWRATRRLIAGWLLHAEPINFEGIHIPAYKLTHPFPVIAIVGVIRPRLFISRQLFDALTPEEFAAAVLHERAHLAARDNLKRPLVRACCDVLAAVPCGGALERIWTEESERAADEYAARLGGAAHALSLASALIKIARLIPEGLEQNMPAGAFLVGEAGAPLASRIRRLTDLAGRANTRRPAAASLVAHIQYFILFCFLTLTALLVTQTQTLTAIHTAIERFVGALQ